MMETWGYTAMFLLMVLENANVPIPSEIILGFAGYLVSQGVFHFWPAIIVGTIAGIVGSVLSYWIGEHGGRPILQRYGKYILFDARKFRAAEELFEHYGGKAVFFGRLLPGVRTFISFPAGIARYPMGKFVLWTTLGTIPWTILLVWLGDMLGERWEEVVHYNHSILIGGGILLLLVGGYFYWRHKKSKNS